MDETNEQGHVKCRFCRWSELKSTLGAWSPVECTYGDTPGPVDPDIAECEFGEIASEKEYFERKRWRG